MNLLIKKEHLHPLDDSKNIIDFIIPEIYRFFYLNLDPNILKNWDNYFNFRYNWWGENNKENVLSILVQGINSLNIYNIRENYIITINPNKNIPGTTAKLYDLCALINYGNLEMPPYPIFEKSFKQASAMTSLLFKNYTNN